jgi:2-phosphoglycerate kinase
MRHRSGPRYHTSSFGLPAVATLNNSRVQRIHQVAKLLVTDKDGTNPTPFLRGILTSSLQSLGIGFTEAYQLATSVRQDLSDKDTIDRGSLRQYVAKRLKRSKSAELATRYLENEELTESITVIDGSGEESPFSRSLLRRTLQTCGLDSDKASASTAAIYQQLLRDRVSRIDSESLRKQVSDLLKKTASAGTAHRYNIWVDYTRTDRPLILLVGGTAGSGKSTVTSEVANRLEIVRSVSTDMLREVMRVMMPERLLPVLHQSSFNAWKALPTTAHGVHDPEHLLTEGYYSQAQLLSLACEAVIARAIRERVSLILEGVHVHPGLLELMPKDGSITYAMIMLGVLDRKELKRRIRGRGGNVPMRRAARYLESFDAIWGLQSHLLSEADRLGVPIIVNSQKDITVRQVVGTAVDALGQDLGKGKTAKGANLAAKGN